MDRIQILCYGDSNTWGTIARWVDSDLPSERLDPGHRWPCVLQAELGDDYHVIEEGLSGRTTIYPRADGQWKNGEPYLLPCLRTHRPLDLVIIMLGTNDLQARKDITLEELPVGISRLVDIVQSEWFSGRDMKPPKVLIMAPVEVHSAAPNGRISYREKFRGEIGFGLSRKFPEVYRKVAQEKGCYYLNAAEYACPGDADGLHFDGECHIRLGKAVAEKVKEIFSG